MEFNNSWSMIYIAISIIVSTGITLSVGCLLLRLNKKEKEKEKEKDSIFSINPEIGLFELPIFWMGITLPLSLFISSGIPLWSNYHLMLTADAYIKFMEISKLPAILLATAIPISAAISRAHSTHQTAKQIRELTKKNNFEIFALQKNGYINDINHKIKNINIKHSSINDNASVHSELFSKINDYNTENGDYQVNIDYKIKVFNNLSEIQDGLLNVINEENEELIILSLDKVRSNYITLMSELSLFPYITFKNDHERNVKLKKDEDGNQLELAIDIYSFEKLLDIYRYSFEICETFYNIAISSVNEEYENIITQKHLFILTNSNDIKNKLTNQKILSAINSFDINNF
jgi:hypothetical protein